MGLHGIKFTKAGWLYIITTLFLGFAAVNTGNNLIFIIVAFLLAIMGMSGFLGKKNINGIKITITLPDEIYAEQPALCSINVINKKRFLDSHFLKVNILNSRSMAVLIKPEGTVKLNARLYFDKRGIHEIKEALVSSSFPFNFFIRSLKINTDTQVTVFPKPLNIPLFETDSSEKKDDEKNHTSIKASEELSSIRNYEYGDSFRHVHWKHFAKSGNLKTKNFTGSLTKPVIIDISTSEHKTEEVLSAATHEILKLCKKDIPTGLKTNKDFIEPSSGHHQKIKLLKILAVYED